MREAIEAQIKELEFPEEHEDFYQKLSREQRLEYLNRRLSNINKTKNNTPEIWNY